MQFIHHPYPGWSLATLWEGRVKSISELSSLCLGCSASSLLRSSQFREPFLCPLLSQIRVSPADPSGMTLVPGLDASRSALSAINALCTLEQALEGGGVASLKFIFRKTCIFLLVPKVLTLTMAQMCGLSCSCWVERKDENRDRLAATGQSHLPP